MSLQHDTFNGSSYDDDDGIVYAFPPAMQRFPRLRAYNHAPERPTDYIELDYQIKNAELTLGDGCARFTAVPMGQPEPYVTNYAVVFRW